MRVEVELVGTAAPGPGEVKVRSATVEENRVEVDTRKPRLRDIRSRLEAGGTARLWW